LIEVIVIVTLRALRELISGQSKLMDQLSRKVATNDKILKNINNRMDSFASAIKN
jgi:hypothetical protein